MNVFLNENVKKQKKTKAKLLCRSLILKVGLHEFKKRYFYSLSYLHFSFPFSICVDFTILICTRLMEICVEICIVLTSTWTKNMTIII